MRITTEDIIEHETYLKLKSMKYGDLLTSEEKDIMLETVIRKAEVNFDQQKKLSKTNLTKTFSANWRQSTSSSKILSNTIYCERTTH